MVQVQLKALLERESQTYRALQIPTARNLELTLGNYAVTWARDILKKTKQQKRTHKKTLKVKIHTQSYAWYSTDSDMASLSCSTAPKTLVNCAWRDNVYFVFQVQFSICCVTFLYLVDCHRGHRVALHDLSCCMNHEEGSLSQLGELGPSPVCPFAHHG